MRHWILVRFGYPILVILSKLFPWAEEFYESAFINFNNQLVKAKKIVLKKAQQLLVLLPQCLQFADCPHKITKNILNCHQCGKCLIADLVRLGEKYGLKINVATGGRLARRIVSDFKPNAIVACACEHELADGVQAVYPLPVLAISNSRPFGPCLNTGVDLDKIEQAVKTFLGGEKDEKYI